MKNKICPSCGQLLLLLKYGIGVGTYKCDKCNIFYFNGDQKKKIIIKNGIVFYNLNRE